METEFSSVWENGPLWEEGDELKAAVLPLIPQPQIPEEPMEFLSRSWSLSASEIFKALANAHKQTQMRFEVDNVIPSLFPDSLAAPQITGNVRNSINARRTGTIGKWFQHHKELETSTVKKKDRIRAENARLHSVVSIAELAAALAAVAAAGNSTGAATATGSTMSMALASAMELLASHCIELAELAGADHDRIASVVKSAVGIQSADDLMTLTAAAATALRGEAVLKARLPKEGKKNAAISPYERSLIETHWGAGFHTQMKDQKPPCQGELLQHTRKGVFRWKRINIYMNKKSQVMIKLKSKHVGGAFSKKNKFHENLLDEIIPRVGMEFNTESDVYDFYNKLLVNRRYEELKAYYKENHSKPSLQ
ncbi:hypothetical protein GQ457_03G022100 [Hibiscus cannabinus]